MKVEQLADWARSKSCNDYRASGQCEHDACKENDEAVELLEKLVRFQGEDDAGKRMSGWLLAD